MGILSRFGDIVQANVNAVLDKMEDPSKMIDQYLRELNENLAEVKKKLPVSWQRRRAPDG